ncbi:uncharacterized protein LOC119159977 isoform X2 [Rhipicephalus microplus]|uniref:uncharacterized protein LOC119159977 isoform X2 n=1 Tax=Rhipicephalus microplus TaxID=6941 RepID=UPI003F6CDD9E
MGEESSVSEMSQSVQSAWEDLVVENPNRRKLEACLVSTIMIVVVCIMGLLLFVVIELQPANNLRKVQRRPNVVFCDNGTCPEFAHRVLGWINFRVKPCVDFHAWVCQSRLKDNPEDTFQQDPERAGTYAANAHFYNLLMRNRDYEMNTAKKVNEQAFSHLVGLFDVCVHGLGKVKGESPLKIFLAHTLWGASAPLNGFAGAAQVGKFMDLQVQLIRDYNFHPFGRLMRLGDNWVIGPPTFLGTLDQISLKGFQGEFQDAYGAFVNKFKVGSRDDATEIFEVEVNMAKAMAVKDVESDYPWNYPCNPKLLMIQADLTEFTTKSTEKKSVAPYVKYFKNARGPLADWGGNLTTLTYFYLNDTDAQVAAYFGCLIDFGHFSNTETTGFMGDLIMLSKTYACNVKAYQSKELLYFPVLGTEPYFDFISDKMFIPYGFTMPPNFHPYVPGIFHHNAPALYFKIISEVYKMSTVKAFEPKKKEGDGAPIFKSIECFRGLVNPNSKNKTGATQIFFDSVAVPMAYAMYRNVLNHAKWDVSKQARVSLIPFFTEGQYFFIQAAQARCEHMDPDPTNAYLRKRDGATAADKVNLPFAMNNPLFANRFGCAKERPMFAKDALCKASPSNSLKKDTEKEYPGVYY